MAFARGRIDRLLRAEGLDPAVSHWAALGRHLATLDSAAGVRADLLRQLRAMDRSSDSVAHVEEWLQGAPPVGVSVGGLLGRHELITVLIARTVRWCAERDLERGLPASDRADWAARLAAAAPVDDLRAAQRAWVEHRDPDGIVHFQRVWPEGADLTPVRRAYLAALRAVEPGFDLVRSVVGHVELTVHGTPEDKRRLVDWSRSSGDRLHLSCGVEIETERGAGRERSCFSVADLGDRGHDVIAVPLGDAIESVPAPEVEPVEVWDPGPRTGRGALHFPAVDRLLRILARAALGRGASSFHPPPLPAASEPDVPMPDPEVTSALIRELWPFVACERDHSRHLRETLRLVFAVDGPLVSAAQDAVRREPTAGNWSRALAALALWRWVAGFAALVERLEARDSPSFHAIARDWLADSGPWGFRPADRIRKPGAATEGEERRYNVFDLDPEGSPQDGALVRLSWPYRRALWTGTWLANQWPPAATCVAELVRRSGLADGRRDGLLWAHCLAFSSDPPGTYDAFKVRVAEVGRVPWSLDELAEWATASRPTHESLRSWRMRNATRSARLPAAPWTAAASWTGSGRDLGWIGARLWPSTPRNAP